MLAVNEKRKFDAERINDQNARSIRIYNEVCNLISCTDASESAAVRRSIYMLVDDWLADEDIKLALRAALRMSEQGDCSELAELQDYVCEYVKSNGSNGSSIGKAIKGYFKNKTESPLMMYSDITHSKAVPARTMHIAELSSKMKKKRAYFFGERIKMKRAYVAGDLLSEAEYCANAYIISSVGVKQDAQVWRRLSLQHIS